jgi:hypothetical protein
LRVPDGSQPNKAQPDSNSGPAFHGVVLPIVEDWLFSDIAILAALM